MNEWFDLREKLPQVSGEYQVMLKGIDGEPDEETTAHCEVMFSGTVHRWTIHGVYEDRVVRWKIMEEKEFNVILKVHAVLEDNEASKQTVRYLIEQDLRDIGWDVDVEMLDK